MLFCPCGQAPPAVAGLCPACYRARQYSARFFGGQRQATLERDGRRCRACAAGRLLNVHHRRRGDHQDLITLCAACHARVHRTLAHRRWMPELLLALWREWHPHVPEQLQFPAELVARGDGGRSPRPQDEECGGRAVVPLGLQAAFAWAEAPRA